MKRIKIIKPVYAAPDHIHTRLYEAGEVHEVHPGNDDGTHPHMPAWLAQSLRSDGVLEETSEPISDIPEFEDINMLHAYQRSRQQQGNKFRP
jgi:hypothetical protein